MSRNPLIPSRLRQITQGEDSSRQFKTDFTNADSLAAEMAAFANADGGTIFIGVSDQGEAIGLTSSDVARVNQLISNTASQGVKSPLAVQTENVALDSGRLVILLKVPKGIDKPYFDKNGVIWLRVEADKRRVNSKEELRRIFQMSHQFHADELPTRATIDAIDKLRFRDFLRDKYGVEYPEKASERIRLLQNLNLGTEDGLLNLAGLLLFGEQPEILKPQFVIKAVSYPGSSIHISSYEDTEDFTGPIKKVFEGSLAFVLRNLHKIQAGGGVNSPGVPEIPPLVFEELLVNALVHRDYLVSAPIRLFVFSDRIEIISPGNLPNNLTVDKILAGNSNLRNPILASFVAKGLLPYRGLGSGVPRAIETWPQISFRDDREGNFFITVITRNTNMTEKHSSNIMEVHSNIAQYDITEARNTKYMSEKISLLSEKLHYLSEKNSRVTEKLSEKIIVILLQEPNTTIQNLVERLNVSSRTVERNLKRLQEQKRLKRIGPDKGGHWHVIK